MRTFTNKREGVVDTWGLNRRLQVASLLEYLTRLQRLLRARSLTSCTSVSATLTASPLLLSSFLHHILSLTSPPPPTLTSSLTSSPSLPLPPPSTVEAPPLPTSPLTSSPHLFSLAFSLSLSLLSLSASSAGSLSCSRCCSCRPMPLLATDWTARKGKAEKRSTPANCGQERERRGGGLPARCDTRTGLPRNYCRGAGR